MARTVSSRKASPKKRLTPKKGFNQKRSASLHGINKVGTGLVKKGYGSKFIGNILTRTTLGLSHVVHNSSREFKVVFNTNNTELQDAFVDISIKDTDAPSFHKGWQYSVDLTEEEQEFDIPDDVITPGHHYVINVQVTSLSMRGDWNQNLSHRRVVALRTIAYNRLTFRAELTKPELSELLSRSMLHMRVKHVFKMAACQWLYRNKPPEYFRNIFSEREGIMEGYLKDNNGDQASVINNVMQGLFFAASVDRSTGCPPEISIYGTRRFSVPAEYIFRIAPNMYFADFYCLNTLHYVTIVITRPGSAADMFCRDKLLSIDPHDNPYLTVGECGWRVTMNVHIEVYMTENVDISDAMRHGGSMFNTLSRGTSRPEGIPKNPTCKICNLY